MKHTSIAEYKRFVICSNAYHIERYLHHNPEIKEKIGDKCREFVWWGARKSISLYGACATNPSDLAERWFYKRNPPGRLYNKNVKLWYKIINEVFKRDNYTCQYCFRVGGKLECDHIIPFSKGGTNDLSNLTTSCRRCNRQKKDKTVDEFIAWREING